MAQGKGEQHTGPHVAPSPSIGGEDKRSKRRRNYVKSSEAPMDVTREIDHCKRRQGPHTKSFSPIAFGLTCFVGNRRRVPLSITYLFDPSSVGSSNSWIPEVKLCDGVDFVVRNDTSNLILVGCRFMDEAIRLKDGLQIVFRGRI